MKEKSFKALIALSAHGSVHCISDAITDLLCNLQHLSEARDLAFSEMNKNAYLQFARERQEHGSDNSL